MKNLISLPKFGGFYEEEFTDAYLESYDFDGSLNIETDEIEHEPTPEIDYRATYDKVARMLVEDQFDGYATRLKEQYPALVLGVEYDHLDSPREYNFRTDEIIAMVEVDEGELWTEVMREGVEVFALWLKKNYSSRDGFVSFIPTDVDEFREEMNKERVERGYSTHLTVIFEFLCRDWDMIIPELFDSVSECIVTE